ncbi:nuclear transport factor 2 family protein [Lysobacter panacisoli]|uniref:DUF4440 domain-containing protein n=1 Tax=Lysobacter panacisoli TaxID=1255263 RepID=A0ABP9KYH7_9GAMM|nr:nuclear transport factor 2 family protein [Lysobacter panacisoli]
MRTSFRTFFALALVLASLSAHADDAATIKALEQQWIDAVGRGDRVFVDKLLHPAYVNTTMRGQVRDKATTVAAPPLPKGATQTLRNVQVRMHGNVAVVTGINDYRAPGAQPLSVAYTDVYLKEGNAWRVISTQESVRSP